MALKRSSTSFAMALMPVLLELSLAVDELAEVEVDAEVPDVA